jgi:protocatechuate 3,4-dioxygenase beta subunit
MRPDTRADRRPYYIANEKLRRNVTEGKPGTALTLTLKVVNASTCKPIKGAAVDIWHCDALGVYSGIQQQNTVGKTFLRGIQRTNAYGIATFRTAYPGWYMAAPCTFTSWSTSAAASCTPVSSSFPTR